MTTKEKIQSHSKAIEILELLERAEKRLRYYQEQLYSYRGADKMQRLYSIYNESDYEWMVKKGERSVSFITGRYERYMRKHFTIQFPALHDWQSPKFTAGEPMPINNLSFEELQKIVDKLEPVLYQPSSSGITKEYLLPENSVPYYTCGPGFHTAMQAAAERMFKNQSNPLFGLVEPVIPSNIHPDD